MRKLLIAVDSPLLIQELKSALEKSFEIYTCSDGRDALQLLESLKPDVLIINLSLYHITGLSVLQNTAYTPPIILALTYYLSNTIIQDAVSAGVKDLLLLPCSLTYILSHLHNLFSITKSCPVLHDC